MGRIVHLHPTRLCNLRCGHCYSASGPDRLESLPVEALESLLGEAKSLGYEVASLSGGEPLLYGELARLVGSARELGFGVQLVTNGFFTSRPALRGTLRQLDRVAVSVDGYGASHDRRRGSPRAWSSALRSLAELRADGIRTGLNVTVSAESLDELADLAGTAVELGVSLLQLHPLQEAGRAREGLGRRAAARCYAAAAILRDELAGLAEVQCDLMPRRSAVALLDGWRAAIAAKRGLPACVPILVVAPDGELRPLCFSMSTRFAVGRLGSGALREQAERYSRSPRGLAALGRLLGDLTSWLDGQEAPAVVNPFEEIARLSLRPERARSRRRPTSSQTFAGSPRPRSAASSSLAT